MMLFLPELTILVSGLILFFFSLRQQNSGTTRNTALLLAGVCLVATLLGIKAEGSLFFAAYQVDLFSQLFKLLIVASTFILLLFSGKLQGVKESIQAEYYLFLFTSMLGLVMLVSSVELLAIFISLELSSFAVYIMVPMRSKASGDGKQAEAGIKYLLYGVVATGFMLFGMSYVFGLLGTTRLVEIYAQFPTLLSQPAAVVGLLLVLAGFFYKLALFPLHFWVPDVYEGAANETTAFIAAIPKIAAVALLIRLVAIAGSDGQIIVPVLTVCALLSMFYGNLSALVQKDIKRLLGFSGISHAGFILVGLLTLDPTGFGTAIYYTLGYVLMSLACFLVVCSIAGPDGRNVSVEDFTGLHRRSPILAITLCGSLFALAGIPPFVGFTGKFLLLLGALRHDHLLLVILAAINTAIAIYYYLSIVRLTFCTDTEERGPVQVNTLTSGVAIMLLLGIVVMGVLPSTFIGLAEKVTATIM